MSEADYSLKDVSARAIVSRAKFRGYIDLLMENYGRRCGWRETQKIPTIGVCGHGRAGKDTAAEFLCGHTEMVYPGSASSMVLPIIADTLGITPEQAWQERHDHRQFWIQWCHAFRGKDYSLLTRMCLGAGDIAVGVRGRLELDAAVRQKVITLTLWIDNPRVPPDETVEYGPDDCDLMVPNHGSRLDLYARLFKLLKLLNGGYFVTVY